MPRIGGATPVSERVDEAGEESSDDCGEEAFGWAPVPRSLSGNAKVTECACVASAGDEAREESADGDDGSGGCV